MTTSSREPSGELSGDVSQVLSGKASADASGEASGEAAQESSRKLSRREQQAETRAALVRAAAVLFASRGFDGTTIQAIAREAGFTRGAFYAHFASKHEILDAAIAEQDASDRQSLTATLGATPVTAQQVAAWISDSQRADLPLVPLRLEMVRQGIRSPEVAELLKQHQHAEVEEFQSLLERAARSLPLRAGLSERSVAQLISALLDGIAIHALIDGELDVSALWSTLVDALTEPPALGQQ